MLGIREPDIYGRNTYEELVRLIEKTCEQKGVEVEVYQSNTEGFIVDKIQHAENFPMFPLWQPEPSAAKALTAMWRRLTISADRFTN